MLPNNMPMYNQGGINPPINNMGGFNMPTENPYGMQQNMPVMGGGQMPDPHGILPQPSGINQSMEVEPVQEKIINNIGKRIRTPGLINEGNALAVGGNQDLLQNNKIRMKNEWQQQLLEQMEEKERK